MHLLSERIGGGCCSEKRRVVFRKHKCGIQKIGGWYLKKRRAVFGKEEGGVQKIVNRWFLRSVEVIRGEFRHMLVVADMDKKQ